MINDLIGKGGIKVSAVTPSQWQVDGSTVAGTPGPPGPPGPQGPPGPPSAATPARVFLQATAPAGALEGDWWIVNIDNVSLMRHDGTWQRIGLPFYTFGNYGVPPGTLPPVDGSIVTQAAWNLDNDEAYVNTAWPTTNPPTWLLH